MTLEQVLLDTPSVRKSKGGEGQPGRHLFMQTATAQRLPAKGREQCRP